MEIDEAVRRMGLADSYEDPQWSTAVAVTDRVVQKAAPEWLEELLFALLRVDRPTYPMRYAFEAALERLARTPGDADRVTAVRMIAAEGLTWTDVRYSLAEAAAWLASAQPLPHLLAVFATADASDELAACLLHETALRHDARAAAGFAERLRAAGHPLGGLPLRPTRLERGLHVLRPPDRLRPEPPRPAEPGRPVLGPGGRGVAARAVPWPDARRALSAHRGWDGDCTEARLFLLDRTIAPADFGALVLRALGADSVGGDVAGPHRTTASAVLRTLFGHAAGGGAYGPGMSGGNARRASWEALAALAGVEDGDLAAVEEAADACTWLSYTSGWHLQVVPPLDLGFACLRPDGRLVAVLAATDAD